MRQRFIEWFLSLQKQIGVVLNFTLAGNSAKVYKVTLKGRKTICFVDLRNGDININKYRKNKKRKLVIGNINDDNIKIALFIK